MSMSARRGKIILAADHGGFELKAKLVEWLAARGLEHHDAGTHGPESVDYPDFARLVTDGVLDGGYRLGVLVCGTGIGMSIAANRRPGVRAALCHSAYTARMARRHNDANVLCLGGRVLGAGEACDILEAFLETDFEGGRHQDRLGKIERA
jgi:ribose 5-phosphate isomerase B